MVGKLSAVIVTTTNHLCHHHHHRLVHRRLSLLPPSLSSSAASPPYMAGGRGTSATSSAATSSSSPFSSFAPSSRSGGRGRGGMETENDPQRSRGRGRGGKGARAGAADKIDALGRLLTRILRHAATELNLEMRSDGYVRVRDLLKLKMKTRANIPLSSHTIDDIREAVRIDNKQRLGLLEENEELLIRANQGHSVKANLEAAKGIEWLRADVGVVELRTVETESLLKPILSAEEIPVCIHGTYRRHLESILKSGLERRSRLHVHFTPGLPSDGEVISGVRRDINMLIFLDVKKAMQDGMKFYMSENKVILTEGFDGVVPAKYFKGVESYPGRKPISIQI